MKATLLGNLAASARLLADGQVTRRASASAAP
jgi:hypothetical protein